MSAPFLSLRHTYLLINSRYGEDVGIYGKDEMEEIFTPAEIAALNAGKVVTRSVRNDAVTYVNMVLAARAVREA